MKEGGRRGERESWREQTAHDGGDGDVEGGADSEDVVVTVQEALVREAELA